MRQGQQIPIALYCSDDTSGVSTGELHDEPGRPEPRYVCCRAVRTVGDGRRHGGTHDDASVNYTVKMMTSLTMPVANGVYGGATAALRATLLRAREPARRKERSRSSSITSPSARRVTGANGEAILNFPMNGLLRTRTKCTPSLPATTLRSRHSCRAR
jgi:hypothetical protein